MRRGLQEGAGCFRPVDEPKFGHTDRFAHRDRRNGCGLLADGIGDQEAEDGRDLGDGLRQRGIGGIVGHAIGAEHEIDGHGLCAGFRGFGDDGGGIGPVPGLVIGPLQRFPIDIDHHQFRCARRRHPLGHGIEEQLALRFHRRAAKREERGGGGEACRHAGMDRPDAGETQALHAHSSAGSAILFRRST